RLDKSRRLARLHAAHRHRPASCRRGSASHCRAGDGFALRFLRCPGARACHAACLPRLVVFLRAVFFGLDELLPVFFRVPPLASCRLCCSTLTRSITLVACLVAFGALAGVFPPRFTFCSINSSSRDW